MENQTKAATVSAAKSEPGAFVFNVNVGRAIFISSGRPQSHEQQNHHQPYLKHYGGINMILRSSKTGKLCPHQYNIWSRNPKY